MAIWKLTIEDDEGQKTVVPLVRGEYTIGRKDGHAVRLTERNISRDHARLRKVDNAYVIEDLGSYNGVFVNGHRLAEPKKLDNGDLILLGDFRIEAHNDDLPRVASLQPKPLPKSSAPPSSSLPSEGKLRAAPTPKHEAPANRLMLLTGAEGGTEFPLDKPRLILGRGDDVDVRVNHSSVSRHHCELLEATPGQYEVVDQASANGVRVNGHDVKKAILNPGDTIELGDVQLKYLSAGQAFVFDAAVAEAARDFEQRHQRRGVSVLTWGAVLLLVLGAAVGGVFIAKSGHEVAGPAAAGAGTSNVARETSAEESLVATAWKSKEAGDPLAAHAALAGLSKDSGLRKDPRCVEIENTWASALLKIAEAETDENKKRSALKEVVGSGADQTYRIAASDELASLDSRVALLDAKGDAKGDPTGVDPSKHALHPPPVASAATNTLAPPMKPPTLGPSPVAMRTAPPMSTSVVTAAIGVVGNCPSWKGDYSAAMRAKDYDCVKAILNPKLNGNISSGEARYLKAACAALGDTTCQKHAADKIQ
ncbi:MAG: hypothetical protein NVSMB1_08900 [Polyangiales bacterium]